MIDSAFCIYTLQLFSYLQMYNKLVICVHFALHLRFESIKTNLFLRSNIYIPPFPLHLASQLGALLK